MGGSSCRHWWQWGQGTWWRMGLGCPLWLLRHYRFLLCLSKEVSVFFKELIRDVWSAATGHGLDLLHTSCNALCTGTVVHLQAGIDENIFVAKWVFSNCRSTRRIYFERTNVLSSYSFLEITILHANGILIVAGPICSILVNRFGCRPVMMVGGIFASLGMIMASFATSIIHIYLSIGVITGEYCFVITYEILMYIISMY